MAAANWTKSTVQTYISKQLRELIERQPDGKLLVRPEFKRVGEEKFLKRATQKRQLFATYDRMKYREVVRYEFLLPLTREDQLRGALDDLFDDDTIRQRLSEIGLAQLDKWIKRNDEESEDRYFDRICDLISEMFGGYSISHVTGRYRSASLKRREEAARMLAADERYIIDETTAAVRFMIPIKSTKTEERRSVDAIGFDESGLDASAVQEISLVHSLFFSIFVEAVVRMVEGEDEIWLLEEAGRNRSLYVWQRA